MKKIIVLLLTLIVSVSLFCACSKDKDKKDSDKASENVSDSQDSLPDNSAIDESDLFSFNLKLDGVKYTLPCDVTEFEKNGWYVSRESADVPEKIMKPTDDVGYDLYKKDENTGEIIDFNPEYNIYAYNFTKSDLKLKDCKIYGFSLYTDSDSEPKGPEVELPGGLIFDYNTKADDILALYGEPYYINYDKAFLGEYIEVYIEYRKREGDFIKQVQFRVFENGDDPYGSIESRSVSMTYLYDPEDKE